ncbi:MAG: glucuronate isomerase, partial [Spirochaetaceae bacterium]
FDSMADAPYAKPLARFLDALDVTDELPRTIIYILNPRDNDMIASLIGCYQDGSVPGKVQFGSAWWFNDQKDGMERHLTAVANMSLLRQFVGMLTDSRSFLSFPRHEYFRRILCNLVGGWVERGEAPADMDLLGGMVEDIAWNNAREFFGIEVEK